MSDDKVIQEIRESLIEIKGTLKNVLDTTNLKMEALDEKIKVTNKRVLDLENNQKWFICIIIGGFITLLYSLFK